MLVLIVALGGEGLMHAAEFHGTNAETYSVELLLDIGNILGH